MYLQYVGSHHFSMASTSLYVKLAHLSSSPTDYLVSPAQPLLPHATTPMGPLAAGTPCALLPVPFLAGSTPTAPPAANTSTPTGPLTYKDDHHGAMLFIVATVCVYGLSIIFFIAGHTQKRELNKDEEQQISHYLKRVHLEECSLDDRKFHVIRLKSELLAGSALGQRHDRRISLLRRPQDQGPRLGVGRAEEEEEEEEEEEDSLHCGAQGPDTPWLNGECSVDDVHEDARPSPKPFRGRRFGCVGFSPAARTSEGPRRPLLTWPLPDIQEDEVPLPSLGDVLSSQHHDPPQIWLPRSAGPPVPDTSPAESAAGGPALQALSSVHAHTSALQALSSSDSMLTQETAQDTAGSHSVVVEELEDGDSSEAEMCTRL